MSYLLRIFAENNKKPCKEFAANYRAECILYKVISFVQISTLRKKAMSPFVKQKNPFDDPNLAGSKPYHFFLLSS